MAGVYYITLASVPGNLLDIFHNGMLKQKLFAVNQNTDIVGVAEGKQEAVRTVSLPDPVEPVQREADHGMHGRGEGILAWKPGGNPGV